LRDFLKIKKPALGGLSYLFVRFLAYFAACWQRFEQYLARVSDAVKPAPQWTQV
jgi:hypothetical protein